MHEKVCDDVGKDINVDVSSLTKKFAISEEDLKFTRRIFQKFDSDSDGKFHDRDRFTKTLEDILPTYRAPRPH